MKEVRGPVNEKPWITAELSLFARQKQREYSKNGKSIKYIQMKNKFKQDIKIAVLKYKEKQMEKLRTSNRNSGYSILKKMGARMGENFNNDLNFSNHINMTSQQIADDIAQHFSAISQEYEPLNINQLNNDIKKKMDEISPSEIPELSEFQVYKKIIAAKKPNSSVPNDIPKKIIQEFPIELSVPATIIFNNALKNLEYPKIWKKEYGIPIPKVTNPENNDQLRLISLTKFLSKTFEAFLVEWILDIIGPSLDPTQFGGMKGNSLTHYLIHMINFILVNLDSPKPTAVMAAIIDFSKAFNRLSHSKIITIMHDLGLPGWLLKIIASYLSERTLVVKYKGSTSKQQNMDGGSPQGTLLGIICFLIQINGIRSLPPVPLEEVLTPPGIKHSSTSAKFVDDLTLAAAIPLKQNLQKDENLVRPLVFHSRTGHSLPSTNNPMIPQLNNLSEFTKTNGMKINKEKTKVMLFNRARSMDFQPTLKLEDKLLEVVEEIKLLGVIVSSDLKWNKNIKHVKKKCFTRFWMLRRMKEIGATRNDMLEVFELQIRYLTEIGCPAWNGSLLVKDDKELERIQKTAVKIILGNTYIGYENALNTLKIPNKRREKICLKFAKRLGKSTTYSGWFLKTPPMKTRTSKK